ncbi:MULTISPECIES: glycosyltransferase [unclassified Cryobacterium]|uniref:glycosyltransferase n=1 Tax=unclassified Cryobacterium TaxID=2649013 RepID=UPI001F542460|nr:MULTISPECIES: glycosyltransferase [unclassified Cryobacterium]MEB0004003.1 glycosyltransferase [Cryobacterium sp. RTC2.1]MEB0201104.1 glycosyltransferase [Cryobacterium sp. 5I3]
MSPAASRLRIALVSLHTSPGDEPGSGDAGGMNVVVRQQAEAMAAAGHTVDIVTRRSSATLPDAVVLAPRLTLRFLQAGPAKPISKGAHEAVIDEFRVGLAALGDYDVIHSHHWFSGMAALPLAQGRGIPHVQSFHSIAADPSTPLSAGERPESPGRMRGEAWLARESDALVAISNAEADTIVTRLGGSPERIFVVSPGVDAELFHPAPGIRTAEQDPGYAIVAARLQPLKGLDLAVEAIAAVPAALRPELIIAGDASGDFDGYIDGLRDLAERNGIADTVRFLGPQTRADLAALFRDARVVLIPSHSETFGLVALEAAASGVPVVASASGGLREAVLDGDTGIVLGSRDPQAWGAAITTLLGDPDLARRLSVDARARAERLDWPRSARGLLDVYRGLLEPCSADEYDDRRGLRIA